MTDLQQLLDEYLATRRALGVRLKLVGSLLQRFVAFAAQSEVAFITTELALQLDSRHEVPPPGLLSHRYRRSRPYLYSDAEIADLLGAAQGLSGTTGLRPFTYTTLLALLAVTGMRSSEPAVPEPRRRRPRTRRSDGTDQQVREVEIRSRSRVDTPGAGQLRGAA